MNSTWLTRKISELPIDILDGDRSNRYPKRSEFQDSGIPFLNSTNIDNGRLDLGQVNFIAPEKYAQIKKGRLRPMDIIMTTRGSIGKVALFNDPQYTQGLINAQMLVIRADGKVINQEFLFFYLCSDIFQKLVANFASGVAQPQIPIRDLQDIPIIYPPLSTQRKIAAILSAYDDLIENNTRRIAILEEMAQMLYREWFVRFRFPGHESVRLVDSPLGPIPEGWEAVKLRAIAEINRATLSNTEAPGIINYINISSVSPGQIDLIETMSFADAPGRARRIVQHGDIIWSMVRPNRKSYALILEPVSNLIVSTGFAVITPREVPYTYLYHTVTTDEFVGYLTGHATGSAYPAVNTADFENADILLPPPAITEAFHRFVGDFYDEKQNLHNRNGILRRTRDLLLPRLISGELDVAELEIAGVSNGGEI